MSSARWSPASPSIGPTSTTRAGPPTDRAVVEQAIARARRRNPAMEASLFDFFREVVLPRDPGQESGPREGERRGGYPPADAAEVKARLRFAMKLQQYTGPVQAKGLEDTAFYRYNVLVSVNEVGGDPARIGRSVEEFHENNAHRAKVWPYDMVTTATHDTKLGEDVRARINVLSECPTSGDAKRRSGCASTGRTGGSSTASRRRTATTSTGSIRSCSAPGRSARPATPRPRPSSSGSPPTCSRPCVKPRSIRAGSRPTRRTKTR